eukprot:GHVO01001022.1.p1 GENE.GHVO01001022.1~~GHVO01001022.1.p1  ORF type:complete len:264 (+),score=18.68 GHVO01001022.1:115-792(+)
MKPFLWFHPKTNRALSETKLRNSRGGVGTFLIRENASSYGDFVLSIITEGGGKSIFPAKKKDAFCQHFVIVQRKERSYSFKAIANLFEGLDALVRHYSEAADGLPCQLKSPCPQGVSPPPLSISSGYTNLLHKSLSTEPESGSLRILQSQSGRPDVDEQSGEGNTALHLSCKRGFVEVTKTLIVMHAELDVADANGFSPLMVRTTASFKVVVFWCFSDRLSEWLS